LQTFYINEYLELQRGYSEDGVLEQEHGENAPIRKGRKTIKSPPPKPPRGGGSDTGEYDGMNGEMVPADRSDHSGKDHLSPEPDGKKKERGKSPFR
jgi:hypothetical protein